MEGRSGRPKGREDRGGREGVGLNGREEREQDKEE